jgi:hypothetical protein
VTNSKSTSRLMRRRWMLALVIVLAAGSIAGYAFGRLSSTPKRAGNAYVDRYRLAGDGIGNLRFGQMPKIVATGLEGLFGRPSSASAASTSGYFRSIGCGLDHEIVWAGLAARSNGSNSDGLTVYFKRSRFVGYSYGPPFGGPRAPAVRSGPMLSTTGGLGLDESPARARRLYGRAFSLTSQPQGTPLSKRLDRLPAWNARTASGRIYGFMESPGGPQSTHHRAIGSISAGGIANTPCR